MAAFDSPADSVRWDTFSTERTVLAVTRTMASTTRALDVLSLLADDERVQTCFTVAPRSQFDAGVDDLLATLGARNISWDDATRQEFDLAISASANGPLHQLQAPLMLLPHGAGHHKAMASATGASGRAGLSPDQLLRSGSVVASAIMLPGLDAQRILAHQCPQALERSRVAGDLTLQQLRRNADSRRLFRSALQVADDQLLLAVSSTWGSESLAGKLPDLPLRLLAELPSDEYKVALILHPNISARHSRYELNRRLSTARAAGLRVVPPEVGWQAAVLAADCLIGDHGSVSFYAADSLPVLFAPGSPSDLPVHSPVAKLIDASPTLDPAAPLRPQIEAALAAGSTEAAHACVGEAIAEGVDAARTFRSAVYELLRLPEPDTEPEPPPPVARAAHTTVSAHLVCAELSSQRDAVRLTRYPAAAAARPPDYAYLAVSADEPRPRLRESAAVLVDLTCSATPTARLEELLRQYPGCRTVAVVYADGVAVRSRDFPEGTQLTVNLTVYGLDAAAAASACHAYAKAGALPKATVKVQIGSSAYPLTISR